MSSAEEEFGSLPDDPLAVLDAELDVHLDATTFFKDDLWQALRDAEFDTRKQLFNTAHKQLETLRQNFSTNGDGEWQSFHRVPGRSTTSIWIARKIRPISDCMHILRCEESQDTDTINYSEFVVSKTDMRANSAHGFARKEPENETWDAKSLGDAAHIDLHGDNVRLIRGKQCRLLDLAAGLNTIDDPSERLVASMKNKHEIQQVVRILGTLTSGNYFEAGASGNLY